MLNIKAIDPAFRIADALIDHNLSVTPRPGSPLEVLYNNSIPTYLTEQELGDISRILTEGCGEIDGMNLHQVQFDRLVALFSKGVAAGHAQAINLVNPAVERVHSRVMEREADLTTLDQLQFNVMVDRYSKMWGVAAFDTLIQRYANEPLQGITIRGGFPILSEQELRAAILTGVDSIDEVTNDLLEDYPEDVLTHLYRILFQDAISGSDLYNLRGPNRLKGGEWVISQSRNTRELTVLGFLLAKGVAKVARDNYSGTKGNFDLDVNSVLNTTAYRLLAARKQQEVESKLGKLVLEWPADTVFARDVARSFIVVNQNNYDEFLRQGGTNEVLIGAAQNDRLDRLDELLAKRERYLEVYRSNYRLLLESNATHRLERMRGHVHEELRLYLQDFMVDHPNAPRDRLWGFLREEVARLNQRDLNHLWVWIRGVMCRSFFEHSDAIRYLVACDQIAETMPDESADVVAFYATVEVLCDLVNEFLEYHRV